MTTERVDVFGALRFAIANPIPPAPIMPVPAMVVVGAVGQSSRQRKLTGTRDTPYVEIRARGGPRSADHTPEGTRRVDVFAIGKSYVEADTLSQSIDDYLVALYNYDWPRLDGDPTMLAPLDERTTRLQYLETESEPVDGIDDDTNLPFMFRSYIVAYADLTARP